MGAIVMTRIDARLVHGQVAARWTKYLNASKIVIVSDQVASDPFMVELFNLAAPMGTSVICYSLDEAVAEWEKDQFGDGRIIILFQDVPFAKKALESGIGYERINVGQVPGGPGRQHAVETVSLSQEEFEMLAAIEQAGVEVYFQSVPDVAETPLSKVAPKFKA